MANEITNQLGIARKTYARGFLRFAHILKALPAEDQIVFQDGVLVGLVDPVNEQEVKVRAGDLIICISRNVHVYTLTGAVVTKDNRIRTYEFQIDITVNAPLRFVSAYAREEDPIGQAIQTLKKVFEETAQGYEYSQLLKLTLDWGAWSEVALTSIGIHVEQRGQILFRMDAYDAERSRRERVWKYQEQKLREEQQLQQLKDTIEAERKVLLLEEEQRLKAREKEFERQEKTRDQLYTISFNLRQAAAEEITKVLHERIIEGFAMGHDSTRISGEYFSLIGIFQGQEKHTDVDAKVINAEASLVEGSIHHSTEPPSHAPEHVDGVASNQTTC